MAKPKNEEIEHANPAVQVVVDQIEASIKGMGLANDEAFDALLHVVQGIAVNAASFDRPEAARMLRTVFEAVVDDTLNYDPLSAN